MPRLTRLVSMRLASIFTVSTSSIRHITTRQTLDRSLSLRRSIRPHLANTASINNLGSSARRPPIPKVYIAIINRSSLQCPSLSRSLRRPLPGHILLLSLPFRPPAHLPPAPAPAPAPGSGTKPTVPFPPQRFVLLLQPLDHTGLLGELLGLRPIERFEGLEIVGGLGISWRPKGR